MKRLIIVLLFTLMILSYSNYDINNKSYFKDNTVLAYPKFNNIIINNFINNYLSSKLNNYNKYLFIDYDYTKYDNIINLDFYNYSKTTTVVNYYIDTFKIDLKTSKIKKIDNDYIMNNYNYLEQSIIDKSKPLVAFTFDDGPNYNTSKLIDILNKYNTKATFFILGNKIVGNEKIIKKMFNSNMEIGNHTYSHKLLTRYKKDKIKEEIGKTNKLIYNIIGEYPTLLRPSYGSTNKKIREISDLPIILWNIDTLDWKNHSSKRIANKILKNVKDGSIILMHDVYSASVNAIDIVIPELLKKDYQIVTISEMAYYKNVKLEKKKVYRFIK